MFLFMYFVIYAIFHGLWNNKSFLFLHNRLFYSTKFLNGPYFNTLIIVWMFSLSFRACFNWFKTILYACIIIEIGFLLNASACLSYCALRCSAVHSNSTNIMTQGTTLVHKSFFFQNLFKSIQSVTSLKDVLLIIQKTGCSWL